MMAGNRGTTVVIIALLTITSVICDFYDFRVTPSSDLCYEIYETNDASPCKQPRRANKISCFEPFKEDKYGLVTPSNETILYVSPRYLLGKCFDVQKGNDLTNVCVNYGGKYGSSLTTPENHTVWVFALGCRTLIDKPDLEKDAEFVSSFKFDYEERSCYQIYSENETINPYTCSEVNIPMACVKEIENCAIITTSNEETVHLGCLTGTTVENNCVEVSYNSTKQKVCLEQLEARCVGFTTPSGLRILVACRECFRGTELVSTYGSALWRQQSAYVKRYVYEENQGNRHLHNINKDLQIYENADLNKFPTYRYICFDETSNCYLLTLNSKETVYIYCRNGSNERPGYYKVVDQESGTEISAYIRVIDEKCIGIITPKNILVMLECFHDFLKYKEAEPFLNEELKSYIEGKYLYPKNSIFFMYKYEYRNGACNKLYHEFTNESMITTPDNETLLLQDTTRMNANGSYSLLDSSSDSDTDNVRTVALRRINNCIGITTRKEWNIDFICKFSTPSSAGSHISPLFAVRSWEPASKI